MRPAAILCFSLLVLAAALAPAAASSPPGVKPRGIEPVLKPRGPLAERQGTTPATCYFQIFTRAIYDLSLSRTAGTIETWMATCCNTNLTVNQAVEVLNLRGGPPLFIGLEYARIPPPTGLGADFVHWSQAKIIASVYADFMAKFYPYDYIYMPFAVEALPNTEEMRLIYRPEAVTVSPDFYTDASLFLRKKYADIIAEEASYYQNFLPTAAPSYDRVTMVYSFARDDTVNFVQLMLPTYLSFVLSMGALALPVGAHFDARMGILGASIFVVVLNINSLNAFLGFPVVLTTGDIINITTLLVVGCIFVESIVEKYLWIKYSKILEKRRKDGELTSEAAAAEIVDAEKGLPPSPDARASDSTAASTATAPKRSSTLTKLKANWSTVMHVESDDSTVLDEVLISMSWITFAFFFIAYIAINIGILVGYKPPACYSGFTVCP